MKRILTGILLLYLEWCYGQEKKCIGHYVEFENTLLNNPVNQYQIVKGYLPLKSEITPVCVTSYYYIGINNSEEIKSNCSSDIKRDKDGMLIGCSRWKWCTNSFYMELDLGKLQEFSFHIILDVTTEVELELPPACNITEADLTDYLLRITMLLYHYARNLSQFVKGTEFIGYAAKVHKFSKLEKLTYVLKPDSISELIENSNYHETILPLTLLALPWFATFIIYITYLEFTEKSSTENANLHSLPTYDDLAYPFTPAYLAYLTDASDSKFANLTYMMYGFVPVCFIASGTMMYFQQSVFTGRQELFYLIPYMSLLALIVGNIFVSVIIAYKVENDEKRSRLFQLKPWIEGIILWAVNMIMQLLSWHLVFVVCGFILNPLRAFLYCMVLILSVICSVILLALIFKFCIRIVWKNSFQRIDTVLMVSLILLLACAYAYIVFIFQISIAINNRTVEEITRSVIPHVFLIALAWLLPKMFLDPKKIWSYLKKNGTPEVHNA